MQLIETTIYTTSFGVEPVTACLLDLGIESTVVEDPRDVEEIIKKKNSYDWDFIEASVIEIKDAEAKVKIYLEDTLENRELVQKIKMSMMGLKSKELEGCWNWEIDLGRLYVEMIELDSKEWENNWKNFFKPREITPTFVVKPSWEEYLPEKGKKIINIDPQTAFGTGGHETTRLCMNMLEHFDPSGKIVLDVGIGSGILSIGAAMLGASKVVGIDIDPIAVDVAKTNIILNEVDEVAEAFTGDFHDGLLEKADIVLSNLMADLVKDLGEILVKDQKAPLLWISSGILISQREATKKAIEAIGFLIVDIKEEGEWCAIAATI